MSHKYSLDKLQLSPDELKDAIEYGYKIAKRIEAEWNKGYYQTRNSRFSLNRAFAAGRQPMAEYLSYLGIDGKESYVNLDMKPLAVAPKFMEVLIGGFMKRLEKPRAKAVDPVSTRKKKADRWEAKFTLDNRAELDAMEEASGVEMTPKNMPVFRGDDEIELFFGTEYKVPEEILFERGISTVLEQNDWDMLKRKVIQDITEVGMAVTKAYASTNGAIKIRRVIPENFIHSYTETDDGRDLGWCGEIIQMSVAQVRDRFRSLSDDDIQELVDKSKKLARNTKSGYGRNSSTRDHDEDFVTLIDFEFKTTKKQIYQSRTNKYGNKIVEKKTKVPERVGENKEIIQKDIYVIYHGVYALGMDKMLHWGEVKNMIKKDTPSEIADAHFNYSMVMPNNQNMENIAIPERMTTSIKAMTVAHLKMMQLMAKMRPSGISVDVDGLNELELGDGKVVSPLEVQAIYDQTGVIYYRGISEDGETRRGLPINELPNNGGVGQIQALTQIFNTYLERLRDEIGVNEYREGTSVNPKLGLGVMQNQMAASNNATDFIYDGYISLFNNTAKKVSIMLYDSVIYGGKAYSEYFAETDVKGRDFDIQIEMMPDDNRRQFLEGMIQTALSAQQIEFEDAFKIRNMDNVKMAEYYLAKAKRRKMEEDSAMAQRNSEMNGQIQQQSVQAKAQADAQLKQMEGQIKVGEITTEITLKKELSEQEFVQNLMMEAVKQGKELTGTAAQYVDNYFAKKQQEAEAQAQAEAQQQQEAQINQAVEEMRTQGMSDEEIHQVLQENGMIPSEEGQEEMPEEGSEEM
jgi:hypothetical protein